MKNLIVDQPIDKHLKPVKDSDGTATSIELSENKIRVQDLEVTGTSTGITVTNNTLKDVMVSGFFGSFGGGTKMFIPINGTTGESSSTSSGNDFRAFVAPFSGFVEQVIVRSEIACGSSTVGLHKSSTNTEVPNSTASGTVVVNMTADDTAFKFDFVNNLDSGANSFSAGDILAISFTPASQSQDTNITMIFSYDTTQGVT